MYTEVVVDSMEFSDQSLLSSMSMTQRKEAARVVVSREDKENTPMPNQAPMSYTPLGVKDGVRGILRQTGTPGSGNGGELDSMLSTRHHNELDLIAI
jgi:hypothetical protein